MKNIESSLKIIAKGAIITLIGIFISKLLTFVYRILIARIGPEEYGTFSLGLAVFGFFTTISLLGLNNGILRFVPHYRALEKKIIVKKIIFFSVFVTFSLSLIFSILLFFLSDDIAKNIFNNPNLSLVIKILSFAIPFNTINNIFFSIFRAFKQVKFEVYIKNILENINKLILTFILVYLLGKGIFGISLSYIIPIFISSILSFYIINKKLLKFGEDNSEKLPKKELVLFSLPLLFSSFFFMLLSWTDTLMLGYFLPPYYVGIYNSAIPTVQILFVIPYALSMLFIPVLSEIFAKKNRFIFKSVYRTTTKWIFILNFPIFLSFILFSKEILYYIFGKDYVSGSLALIILSFGFFINYSFINSDKILKVIKKTKIIFLNSLIIAILNIVLNLLLIPKYGILGASIATSSSFIILTIMVLAESTIFIKFIPINYKWLNIFAAAIISFLIILYTKSFFHIMENLPSFFLAIISLFVVYSFLIFIFRTLEKEDFLIINSIINKIKDMGKHKT